MACGNFWLIQYGLSKKFVVSLIFHSDGTKTVDTADESIFDLSGGHKDNVKPMQKNLTGEKKTYFMEDFST